MFHHPPPPEKRPLTIAETQAMERESERQASDFYPYMGEKRYRQTVHMIQNGIESMIKRGAARVNGTEVEFWHPGDGEFVAYTHEYNTFMLAFLRDFRNGGKARNAHLN